MNKLFVSSIFRSGSTYLSNVLNSLSNVAFASDPFFPIYAAIQQQLTSNLGLEKDCISDYYFCDGVQGYLEGLIGDKFIDSEISPSPNLNYNLELHQTEFSAHLIPISREIKWSNKSILEALQIMFDAIKKSESDSRLKLYGFKEVWLSEFAWPILNAFDDAHVIFLVRDPRDILRSNMWSNSTYPATFIGKQWRKHVEFAIAVRSKFPSRTLIVRYEDMVIKDNRKDLSSFIALLAGNSISEIESCFENPYTQAGLPWRVNTNRPRQISELQNYDLKVKLLEFMCRYELDLMGYEPTSKLLSLKEFEELIKIDKSCFNSVWAQSFADNLFSISRIKPEFIRSTCRIEKSQFPVGSFLTLEYESKLLNGVL